MPKRPDYLALDEARRMALNAQGLARPPARRGRPADPGPRDGVANSPSGARILGEVERLGALQIDSVNVLVRAHYLPLFSRLGPYRMETLDRLAYRRKALFEYWGHQASLLPTSMFPILRHRMEGYRDSSGDPTNRGAFARWAEANRVYIDGVRKDVLDRGPLGASELTAPGERRGPWWGWPKGKVALEWLFRIGEVAIADRRNWERLYDVVERVIPEPVLNARVPRNEADVGILMTAARALGVATADDLAYYFVQKAADTLRLAKSLAADGLLEEVRVEGWKKTAFLPRGTRVPTGASARALVSPFDSLVWDRRRTARVFEFDYRIEIYTPAPKRRFGYYVLPFLLGDRFVARVDLKADRKERVLLVPAVHLEQGVEATEVLGALAAELRLMAGWLGFESVGVGGRSSASRELRRVVA